MTRDDIIRMARQHADEVTNGYGVVHYEFDLYGLEKFALLITAAERERIIAANTPEIEKVNGYIKALEDAVAAEALRARLANEFNPDWDAMGVMVEEQQRMAKRIEELEAALAQPEQEPVAYDKTDLNAFVQNLYDVKMREGKHGHYETMFYVVQQTIKHVCGNKQPAAWLCKNKKSGGLFALTREQLTELGYGNISMPPFEKVAPLYTAPPQREFMGLTDEQVKQIEKSASSTLSAIYLAEAQLKGKNGY